MNDSSLIADEDRDKERKKMQTIEYQEELRHQVSLVLSIKIFQTHPFCHSLR